MGFLEDDQIIENFAEINTSNELLTPEVIAIVIVILTIVFISIALIILALKKH